MRKKCLTLLPPPAQTQLHSQVSPPFPLQQYITHCLCFSIILRTRFLSLPCFSMGVSHGRQSFTSFNSVGPSHGLQSFTHRWLWCGCPPESQALSANLLQHELFPLRAHRSCKDPAPLWAFHVVTASFRSHLLQRGVLWLWVDLGSPWAAGHSCLP